MVGETILRLRSQPIEDVYGSERIDWSAPAGLEIEGCAVAFVQGAAARASELHEVGRRSVSVDVTVYAPAGADVTAADRLVIRGLMYEVTGSPADWRSPFTDWHPGVVVQANRVEG